MNEKFNKNVKVEKFTTMLGIAVRLIIIDPLPSQFTIYHFTSIFFTVTTYFYNILFFTVTTYFLQRILYI